MRLIKNLLSTKQCKDIIHSIKESYRRQDRLECTNYRLPIELYESMNSKYPTINWKGAIQIYNKDDYFEPHRDTVGYPNYRILSMTVCLNDEYKGGKFFVDSEKITLDIGDAVVFKPGDIHWVTPVTKGTRYSLAMWGYE